MENTLYDINKRDVLPDQPGVYKFYNTNKELIYVGKAKSLKKRVGSYFNNSANHNYKTKRLVKNISFLDYTIVNTELDALLLENNLIKQAQPKYNILLKDDKTFPYLCISNERFPQIFSTRKFNKYKGEYFGPYSSVVAMHNVLDLIRKLYTIRTCKLNLSEKNIKNGQFKVCLEYHIGNCKGPCEGLQKENDYNQDIASAKNILKGNLGPVRQYFKDNMLNASNDLNFELAQQFKNKLDLLDKFQIKSTVVSTTITNLLVFTYTEDEQYAYINYLRIDNGAIIQTQTNEIKKALDETPSEILATVTFDIVKDIINQKFELISNIKYEIAHITSTVPKIGDKDKLIKLSLRNALEFKKNKLLKKPLHDKKVLILEQLKTDLRLNELPKHIECFDNSNIQGTNPVASMVCFKNGKPSKSDYRHYNIKTVTGPDDFSSMKEVVGRRYKHLLEENKPLPNLIVIDGGKGQLSSATEALKTLNLYGKIPILGIAKRLEEIYYPEDQLPLLISKKSSSLSLLQQIRDEAHRFAITFHRQKRSKSSLVSELDTINGIGNQTKQILLTNFKTVKKIKEASEKELTSLIGGHKSKILKNYFNKKGS